MQKWLQKWFGVDISQTSKIPEDIHDWPPGARAEWTERIAPSFVRVVDGLYCAGGYGPTMPININDLNCLPQYVYTWFAQPNFIDAFKHNIFHSFFAGQASLPGGGKSEIEHLSRHATFLPEPHEQQSPADWYKKLPAEYQSLFREEIRNTLN